MGFLLPARHSLILRDSLKMVTYCDTEQARMFCVCVCVIVWRVPHLFPAQITVVLLVLLFFEIGSSVLGQTPTCHPLVSVSYMLGLQTQAPSCSVHRLVHCIRLPFCMVAGTLFSPVSPRTLLFLMQI